MERSVIIYTKLHKYLYKKIKDSVKEVSQFLPIFAGPGSEDSYSFPKPRNFAEVTILSEDIKKNLAKINYKGDQNFSQQSELSSSRSTER